MKKTIVATGMAVSLAFAGLGSVSAEEDTSVDLGVDTSIEAAIEDEGIMTSTEFQSLAEANGWEVEDLQLFAEAHNMTEVELQDWAEENGWDEEARASLDLDLQAGLNLDNLLEEDDDEDEDEDDNDGLLGGLLGGIL
ncbi:hypothetical protein LCM20_18005 [Halobacillus litoralis]|uniref:hypothetical protein n=1 Tax=Halobacillus litoralis TaxID=45668 RepID=UPI001CD7B8F5|nr:hypothetical protein [Halobacillus litoralis]MCA0972494.1 hypothetical protein [Halobacillus litoralis]